MHPSLSTSKNVPHIDALLRSMVSTFEIAFPGRVRASYVLGSYAERTAVALSDLDCLIIFKQEFENESEQADAQQVGLHRVLPVTLKPGSVLVYGKDIRAKLPLPSLPLYSKALAQGAVRFIARLRDQEALETRPVDYPEPADEFFGYTRIRIPTWYPAHYTAGTKELVATVSQSTGGHAGGDSSGSVCAW